MQRFVLRRLIASVITLISATAIIFTFSRLAGDPLLLYATPGYGFTEERISALKAKLGLDDPLPIQYFRWVGQAVRGDLGRSLRDETPVTEVIFSKVGASVQLGAAAWLFATILGVPLGILSAIRRGSIWDYVARGIALFGQSIPVFWIGIMAVLLFSVYLGWLPSGGRPVGGSFTDQVKHFILPVVTMGWLPAASYLRITRSAMLEVLNSEYMTLARAKGVSRVPLIWKHAFRNALIPPLTLSVIVLTGFLGGSVVVESIFAWPGIGRLATRVVWNNDFPVLLAVVLIYGATVVLFNFIVDLAYAFVDPRIRY